MSETGKKNVRVILTALGGVLMAHGMVTGEIWEPVAGLGVLLTSLVWGLWNKTGVANLASVSLKLLNAGGAALVTWGLASQGTVESWLALLGPVLALIFTHLNGGQAVHAVKSLLLFAGVVQLLVFSTGCRTTYNPETGEVGLELDPFALAALAQNSAEAANRELAEKADKINEELRLPGKGGAAPPPPAGAVVVAK